MRTYSYYSYQPLFNLLRKYVNKKDSHFLGDYRENDYCPVALSKISESLSESKSIPSIGLGLMKKRW